jgi:hypothetical protein
VLSLKRGEEIRDIPAQFVSDSPITRLEIKSYKAIILQLKNSQDAAKRQVEEGTSLSKCLELAPTQAVYSMQLPELPVKADMLEPAELAHVKQSKADAAPFPVSCSLANNLCVPVFVFLMCYSS